MHRKIVESIKDVIQNSPIGKYCNVYVKPQQTGGFWAMAILLEDERDYCIPHIKATAESIGLMHGESLNIQVKNRCVTID